MLNLSFKAVMLGLGIAFISACTMPATTIPSGEGSTLAGNSPEVDQFVRRHSYFC